MLNVCSNFLMSKPQTVTFVTVSLWHFSTHTVNNDSTWSQKSLPGPSSTFSEGFWGVCESNCKGAFVWICASKGHRGSSPKSNGMFYFSSFKLDLELNLYFERMGMSTLSRNNHTQLNTRRFSNPAKSCPFSTKWMNLWRSWACIMKLLRRGLSLLSIVMDLPSSTRI